MIYSIVLTPEAVDDIDKAVIYYSNLSPGPGFNFSGISDVYFQRVVFLPAASAIRYDNIRVKAVDTFP